MGDLGLTTISIAQLCALKALARMLVGLVCALSLVFLSPSQAQSQSSDEYSLKAVVLFKLLKFVEWPDESSWDHLEVCIFGPDPFGDALDALEGKPVRGLPLKFRRLAADSLLDEGCQVVYFSPGLKGDLTSWLRTLEDNPILSVSDRQEFALQGGGIELATQRDRLRFIINQTTVNRAGLQVAAPLLSLSDVVK